jgi:hypothetical protein
MHLVEVAHERAWVIEAHATFTQDSVRPNSLGGEVAPVNLDVDKWTLEHALSSQPGLI